MPEAVSFQTKPQLARQMLERTLQTELPAGWVTADEVYGGDRRRRLWLEAQQQPFVLAIKRSEPLWVLTGRGPWELPAADIAAGVEPDRWVRLSAGDGAKGPRLYTWAQVMIRPLRQGNRI